MYKYGKILSEIVVLMIFVIVFTFWFKKRVKIMSTIIINPEVKVDESIEKKQVDKRNKSDLLLPPTMNTKDWKWNREEANER